MRIEVRIPYLCCLNDASSAIWLYKVEEGGYVPVAKGMVESPITACSVNADKGMVHIIAGKRVYQVFPDELPQEVGVVGDPARTLLISDVPPQLWRCEPMMGIIHFPSWSFDVGQRYCALPFLNVVRGGFFVTRLGLIVHATMQDAETVQEGIVCNVWSRPPQYLIRHESGIAVYTYPRQECGGFTVSPAPDYFGLSVLGAVEYPVAVGAISGRGGVSAVLICSASDGEEIWRGLVPGSVEEIAIISDWVHVYTVHRDTHMIHAFRPSRFGYEYYSSVSVSKAGGGIEVGKMSVPARSGGERDLGSDWIGIVPLSDSGRYSIVLHRGYGKIAFAPDYAPAGEIVFPVEMSFSPAPK